VLPNKGSPAKNNWHFCKSCLTGTGRFDDNYSVVKYRLENIGELARQLAFTPHDARTLQLSAAENLLLEIDPLRAYPAEFIVYRITGYHPQTADQTLLTGLALQHDLGLLTEQVSDTLNLQAEASEQPVLSIDEVCQRFNVTSKTIQRWRRRGLAARRVICADGKRRVGFLLEIVERYLAKNRDQVDRAANFTQVTAEEHDNIISRARRLAVHCQCCVNEIARRIGRKLNRSPLTIVHILKRHDVEFPEDAIFRLAAQPIGEEDRGQIVKAYRRGTSIKTLAKRACRQRAAVYRVIVEDRLERLNKRKVKLIDDPLYHQPDAAAVIAQIAAPQDVLEDAPRTEDVRVPRDLPPYLRELYRTPLLSAARERALFLKMNFHKFQFIAARRRLEPQFARIRNLLELEAIRRDIVETKNQIVQANLRLVVSVARKHVRPGLGLMELISEGNITLLRAVDAFDTHRGNRFSTYVTLSLMKEYARSVPQMLGLTRPEKLCDEATLAGVPDRHSDAGVAGLLHRDQVQQLMTRLDQREREVLLAHYGLRDGVAATYEQVGQMLKLPKQRVRQIELRAIAKLRNA